MKQGRRGKNRRIRMGMREKEVGEKNRGIGMKLNGRREEERTE